jgi:hypothetical protein
MTALASEPKRLVIEIEHDAAGKFHHRLAYHHMGSSDMYIPKMLL